jgi:two-component system chemotaxis response regulator CheY
MAAPHVLSVGQCFADHGAISRTLGQQFAAEVVAADTAAEALAAVRQQVFDLVLVNRVLDADGSSGLEVIRQIKADEAVRQVPVMLVSNHEDAQRQAVELGALPGFGKAALGQPPMLARLKPFLQETT